MAKIPLQSGLEWLPEGSEQRKLDWSRRGCPSHIFGYNPKTPFDMVACDFCYEPASWYCSICRDRFCFQQDCKHLHLYHHTLSRMGGNDDVS